MMDAFECIASQCGTSGDCGCAAKLRAEIERLQAEIERLTGLLALDEQLRASMAAEIAELRR
jgi:hypothetical protein